MIKKIKNIFQIHFQIQNNKVLKVMITLKIRIKNQNIKLYKKIVRVLYIFHKILFHLLILNKNKNFKMISKFYLKILMIKFKLIKINSNKIKIINMFNYPIIIIWMKMKDMKCKDKLWMIKWNLTDFLQIILLKQLILI
jgi:hypothetical protein